MLAIGLLGLAHMQSFGLLNVEKAYQRSQASELAYAIADKMRANFTNAGSYLTSFMVPAAATAKANCKTTTGYSAGALAENDLFEWNQQMTAQQPGPTGVITLAGVNYIFAITWVDAGNGDVDLEDPSFEVSFSL